MLTTGKVQFAKLTINDIVFLHEPRTLFSVDFRAMGETPQLAIPAMFKYENLSQWLVGKATPDSSYVLVNDAADSALRSYEEIPQVCAPRTEVSQTSVYERIPKLPLNIKNLWVAVPHPKADEYARKHKLTLNYSYEDFLRYNDKLQQKQYLGSFSPDHKTFKSAKAFRAALEESSGFLKCRHGSGGFKVISPPRTLGADYAKRINPAIEYADWYEEATVKGEPCSVQAIQDRNGEITIFGFTKQYLTGTVYEGGEVLNLDTVPQKVKAQIVQVCGMIQPFIKDYRGFFGIDFMVDRSQVMKVLELNVRMTAITIPTLLSNDTGTNSAVYYHEDVSNDRVTPQDIALAVDLVANTSDIMQLSNTIGSYIGEAAYIQFAECQSLPAHLTSEHVANLAHIIDQSVSRTITSSYHNFWPYGWTLSFILAESHCTLSSWHTERNVLMDVFCCSDMDVHTLTKDLAEYFGGAVVISGINKRYSK